MIMKKTLVGSLCVAVMMLTGVNAVAAETSSDAQISQYVTDAQYTLKVNSKNIDFGALNIIENKGKIMVPLRSTAEALGFVVTWNGEKQSIHLDDGMMQTDLTLGQDNYFAYSSKAIGMTAPESLGLAPTVINGATYVPIDFFKILLTDPDCVSIKDRVISISKNLAKSAEERVEIPNPLVNYSTLVEAKKAIGYNFSVPATLPNGYQMKDIIVISNKLAEIFYLKGDHQIVYRTAKGTADISGDYRVYDNVKTITAGEILVTVKGERDSIKLATWTKNGESFSLAFDAPVQEQIVSTIIESIK